MDRRPQQYRLAYAMGLFVLAASRIASAAPQHQEYLRCTYTDSIGGAAQGGGVLIYKIAPGEVRKWSNDWGGLWQGNDCQRGNKCVVSGARVHVARPSEDYVMELDRKTGRYSLTISGDYEASGNCIPTSKPVVQPGRGPHGEYESGWPSGKKPSGS